MMDSLARRVLGAPVDPELRALLGTVLAGHSAHFALVTYFSIWATHRLGVSAAALGLAYVVAAFAAFLGGPVVGRISDAVGRSPIIRWSLVVHTVAVAVLILVTPRIHVIAFVGLLVTMVATASRIAATTALIADVAERHGPERRRGGFAQLRVAANIGAVLGPVLGATMTAFSWPLFFLVLVTLDLLALLGAKRLHIPVTDATPPPTPAQAHRRLAILREPVIGLIVVATVASWCVYYVFELVLPIVATTRYAVPVSQWGFLYALNAISIVLLQVRVTRWTDKWSVPVRLLWGMCLLGGSFLVLLPLPNIVGAAICVIVFSFGEMFWLPASQEQMTDAAPADRRGAVLGLLNSTVWVGLAATSVAGLAVLEYAGPTVVWVLVASIAAVSTVCYLAAARRLRRQETALTT
jgi:predicted MFS family arabinose efflux permease